MDANGRNANDDNRLDSPTFSGSRGPGTPPTGGGAPPLPPRRGVTTAILGVAVLTLLVVLGAARRSAGGPRSAPGGAAPALPPPGAPLAADPPGPPATPPAPVAKAPTQRPQVELVFALDTTGSMSGLIEGAKQKIWSMASFVAQGQPTPDLRVGLVAYRDIGDAYVTKVSRPRRGPRSRLPAPAGVPGRRGAATRRSTWRARWTNRFTRCPGPNRPPS